MISNDLKFPPTKMNIKSFLSISPSDKTSNESSNKIAKLDPSE